jgi:hypothetical protein
LGHPAYNKNAINIFHVLSPYFNELLFCRGAYFLAVRSLMTSGIGCDSPDKLSLNPGCPHREISVANGNKNWR